jgi:hypothetical protein
MELTITTDRSKQWSRTLYIVDEETFARIFQILKENNVTIPAGCTCNTETLIYEHHLGDCPYRNPAAQAAQRGEGDAADRICYNGNHPVKDGVCLVDGGLKPGID